MSASLRFLPATLARQNTEASHLLDRAVGLEGTADEAGEISSLAGRRTQIKKHSAKTYIEDGDWSDASRQQSHFGLPFSTDRRSVATDGNLHKARQPQNRQQAPDTTSRDGEALDDGHRVSSEDKSSSTYKQFNPETNELRRTGYFGQGDRFRSGGRGDSGLHPSEDADKKTVEAADQIDTYRRPASLLAHHILRQQKQKSATQVQNQDSRQTVSIFNDSAAKHTGSSDIQRNIDLYEDDDARQV